MSSFAGVPFQFLAVFVIVCVTAACTGVFCDNVTDKYPSGNFQTRKSRLLSFSTDNEDSITIELDFNVPFLHIPIKQTMDMAQGSFANINIGAVALAGMMAFGAAIIVPATYALLMKPEKFPYAGNANTNSYGNKYRSDSEPSQLWSILASIDRALSENEIDSTSCVQRALCWTVQSSNSNLSNGKASSTDKIIDGLATNDWIKGMMDGSVFKAAIDSGLSGENCSVTYKQCKVNQDTIKKFGKRIVNAVYSRK